MNGRWSMPRVITILLAFAWLPVAASGQVGIAFDFSFSNPGARSLGFGGAFVALADDATAAFANPAGLTQLVQPEVSLEVRLSGRVGGESTGIGLGTGPGSRQASFDNEGTGLSFLSFVYPRQKWSIAFHRHLLANSKANFEAQGLFADGPGALSTFRQDWTELEIVTYGLSGAFKILENLSLGLGVTYFDGLLQGGQDSYLWDEDSLEGYFGPDSSLSENLTQGVVFTADGSEIGFSAGLLWRLADNWSLGSFYRQGPGFELEVSVIGGPASDDPNLPPGAIFTSTHPIDYPDGYGAGLAYRSPGGHLTVSFEWDHVEYSTILDGLGEAASGARFVADGDELHLGAEYAFLGSRPLFALRAGLWRDPNHQVQGDQGVEIPSGLIGQGEDEPHYAIGFGAVFKGFQLDMAADFSQREDTLSISGIYAW
ncbi:MAG: outer membrane protein transport protein [Thermoanaerobaculia bacterium]